MKLRRSRAGEDGNLMPLLVTIGVGLVILFLAVLIATRIYHSGDEEQLCRTSIKAHSKIVYASIGEFAADIECKPKEVQIATSNGEKAKQELAETMKFCWDRWQRGELELFQEDGIYCNPCAFVSFDKEQNLVDFPLFLLTTPIEKDGPTYAQYLTSHSTEQAAGNVEIPEDPSRPKEFLPTQIDYAVLFVYAKGEGAVGLLRDNLKENPTLTVNSIVEGTIHGAGKGALVAGGGILAFYTATAAAGLSIPGPGWVVTGVALLGIAIGGYKGASNVYNSDFELPQWTAQVVLVPNTPEDIKSWNCAKAEQQTLKDGTIKDV